MFLSTVLYLSSQSTQPQQTVKHLLVQLNDCGFHFSLVIVVSSKHTLSKELGLGQEGIIYTVDDSLSISEGLNEGLKFVNQSTIYSDYICLFYDDFKLSDGYFSTILKGINGDIDNVLIVPNYGGNNINLPLFSLNGVVLRNLFLQLMLGRLRDEYISWEDYPYYYALARKYKVIKSESSYFTKIDVSSSTKNRWIAIGQGFKEKNYSYILVFRTILQLSMKFEIGAFLYIFIGYIKGARYKYPSKILRKTTPSKLRVISNIFTIH
jgi:hypothetical protein